MNAPKPVRLPVSTKTPARLEPPADPQAAEAKTSCTGCGSCLGRRDFFRLGFGATISAAAALLPTRAHGATVGWLGGLALGSEVRYALPASDGVQIDRNNEVILVRYEGIVAAFALSCPHQRSMLRWREDDGIFRCTKHRSEYTPVGVYSKGRATRNMDRLGILRDGDEVVVDRTVTYHSDEDPAGWVGASVPAP